MINCDGVGFFNTAKSVKIVDRGVIQKVEQCQIMISGKLNVQNVVTYKCLRIADAIPDYDPDSRV